MPLQPVLILPVILQAGCAPDLGHTDETVIRNCCVLACVVSALPVLFLASGGPQAAFAGRPC